jgi:hypothetical protein
MPVIGGGPFL